MAGFGRNFGKSFGVAAGSDTGSSPLTATPEPTATPPRVRLDIVTDQSSVTVYRVAPDGTRAPVRTYDDGPLPVSGGSAVLYDSEVPFGVPVYYSSDASAENSETVVLDSNVIWLQHPNVPSRSMPVRVAEVSDRSAPANVSVRYPLGRKFPIRAHDGQRKAETYTLTLRTDSAAEVAKLRLLLNDLATLLLNIPPSLGWVDTGTEYIGPGDLSRANPAGFEQFTYREWELPVVVAARPAGGSQAFNTYGYSKSLYPTYADRKAAHATYGEAFDIG